MQDYVDLLFYTFTEIFIPDVMKEFPRCRVSEASITLFSDESGNHDIYILYFLEHRPGLLYLKILFFVKFST